MHVIVAGRKKVEAIEEKLDAAIKSLELAKHAYLERFQVPPEHLLRLE